MFPQVGNWIAWSEGNEKEVRIGEDPMVGAGERYKLLGSLIVKLRSSGISNPSEACSHRLQKETLWKNFEDLGLDEGLKEEWNEFVSLLQSCFIHLEDDAKDNLVCTKNPASGDFTTKLSYKSWALEHYQGEKMDWWKQVWKSEVPFNAKITSVHWESLKKRGWIGPN